MLKVPPLILLLLFFGLDVLQHFLGRSAGKPPGRLLVKHLRRPHGKLLWKSLGRSLGRFLGKLPGRPLERPLERAAGKLLWISPQRPLGRALIGLCALKRCWNREMGLLMARGKWHAEEYYYQFAKAFQA
jgi:hypothetical protein